MYPWIKKKKTKEMGNKTRRKINKNNNINHYTKNMKISKN